MRKILLFTTMILCLSFFVASCSDDDFTVEKLGPASLEVIQDSLTFRFWLENEIGDVTNVFSKDEHFMFKWSITNNHKIIKWMEIHPGNYKNFCSVYNHKGLVYIAEHVYNNVLKIESIKPNETKKGGSTLLGWDSKYPNLSKGKYYTLVQPLFHNFSVDTLDIGYDVKLVGSVEFSELRINFGIK